MAAYLISKRRESRLPPPPFPISDDWKSLLNCIESNDRLLSGTRTNPSLFCCPRPPPLLTNSFQKKTSSSFFCVLAASVRIVHRWWWRQMGINEHPATPPSSFNTWHRRGGRLVLNKNCADGDAFGAKKRVFKSYLRVPLITFGPSGTFFIGAVAAAKESFNFRFVFVRPLIHIGPFFHFFCFPSLRQDRF